MKSHKDKGREKRASSPAPFLVVGVGNILLRDEGVGVRVIEAMKNMALPDNVELLDAGTASLAIFDSLENREMVILIDAAKGGGEPGTIYRFSPGEVTTGGRMFSSLHDIGLLEVLRMAHHLGGVPREITIFGIEPKELAWGLELSPEVSAVIPRVIELVLNYLKE